MNVKFFQKPGLITKVLLPILLISSVLSLRECNVPLLKYFGLTPNKFPLKMNMKICGNIEDNCCSQADELRIFNLWTEFSTDKVKRYVSNLFKGYKFILDSHDKLLSIDPEKIIVERSVVKSIPFEFKICERSMLLKDLMDPKLSRIDLLNHNKILDIPGFDSRKLQKGLLNLDINLDEYQSPEFQPRELELEKETPKKQSLTPKTHSKRKLKKTHKSKISNPNPVIPEASTANTLETSNEVQKEASIPELENSTKELETQSTDQRQLRAPLSMYERKFKFEEELPERKVDCTTQTRYIDKRITTTNNFKKTYCKDLRGKIQKFRIDDFNDYMNEIKIKVNQMINTKRTFYCALCNMDTQTYINPAQKTITFTKGFCRNLVNEYKDYIKFQNIIFIEYIDLIMQYMRCFQTTAEERVFPYPNFLTTFKNQFEYIEKCFENVDNENYMEYCRFLCDKYSYTSFSTVFDGNPDFLSKVQFLLISFFRKIESGQAMTVDYEGIAKDLNSLDNLNFKDPFYKKEKKAAPKQKRNLNKSIKKTNKRTQKIVSSKQRSLFPAKYIEDPDVKLANAIRSNEMITKMKNLGVPSDDFNEIEEEEDNKKIYETREEKPVAKSFRSKFSSDPNAIDPSFIEENSDFGIDPVNIITEQCKVHTDKEEPKLEHNIILDYFSFNVKDINSFKNDLFLPFADYSYFEQQGSTDETEEGEKKLL